KRALVAVGHTILVLIYHLLREGTTYTELGADYFDRLDSERLTRTLVRRLERLGHEVVLKPKEPAALSGSRSEEGLSIACVAHADAVTERLVRNAHSPRRSFQSR